MSDSPVVFQKERGCCKKVQCCHYNRYCHRSRRAITKTGEKHLKFTHLAERSAQLRSDFVTTVINARWRFVISGYLLAMSGSCAVFAMIWYLISYAHNDLAIDDVTGISLHEGNMKCSEGATTFAEFFLLSFELQSTIGFGERYPTEECTEATVMMIVQIIVSVALEGILIGIIYAKLTRPPRNQYEQKFSRNAVICQRDSKFCLLFQIYDCNGMHAIDSKLQACLVGTVNSVDGKTHLITYPLKLEDDGHVLAILPVIVCHVIDKDSPLYNVSAKQLLEKQFEIIVTFTGSSSLTGQISESRTSYLSNEVLWGHRFVNMIEYDAIKEQYFVEYNRFDVTEAVNTPLCSAERIDDIQERFKRHIFKSSTKKQHTKKTIQNNP